MGWTAAARRSVTGRGFRHPQIAHLSRAHEIGHRTDRFLDRHVQIHAMLIVEVDDVDAQPLQRRVTTLAHVLRRAVDTDVRPCRIAHVPEFGRKDDGGPAIADGLSHQDFVGVRAIHVGRIDERHSQIQRSMNRLDRLLVVATRVELGHAHAPEADGRNKRTLFTELAVCHVELF